MRGVAFRTLVSVVAFIAVAMADLGPRAAAGFISAAGAGAATPVTLTTDAPPVATPEFDSDSDAILPNPGFVPSGGTTTSSSNTSSGTGGAFAAHLSSYPLLESGLVVFFREPSARLRLSKYSDAILDPPRAV